ncbi:hypothetical protein [Nocardioides donggukensis]|uniref:Uncharacterized protein n=1 Tax=Nocardioides donggukensis TaxID=2774019 RepID=A0A927K6T5_9ACTN|nr:hypothetical protein [Nocardioides donggukensis]MBD8870068.1 hypothetical protein [Nocardioides donggukensis]
MNAKSLLLVLVVLFVGFYMVQDPRGLADTAGAAMAGLWQLMAQFFEATIRFVDELV